MGRRGLEFIAQTKGFWAKRSGRLLSDEEAREAAANVSGFFRVLAEWKREACEDDEQKERGRGPWSANDEKPTLVPKKGLTP